MGRVIEYHRPQYAVPDFRHRHGRAVVARVEGSEAVADDMINRMVEQEREKERLAKLAEQRTKEQEARETPQPDDTPR